MRTIKIILDDTTAIVEDEDPDAIIERVTLIGQRLLDLSRRMKNSFSWWKDGKCVVLTSPAPSEKGSLGELSVQVVIKQR